MTQLRTIHERRDGVYYYIREVTIEDAVGQEYSYQFAVERDSADDPDAYEYEGDGDPPESAREALEAYVTGDGEAASA